MQKWIKIRICDLFCMYFLFRPILWFILLLFLVCLQVIIVILGAIEQTGFVIGCVGIFCLSKGFLLILQAKGQKGWTKIFFIEYYGLICKKNLWRGPRIYIYIYIYILITFFIYHKKFLKIFPNLMFSRHPLIIQGTKMIGSKD